MLISTELKYTVFWVILSCIVLYCPDLSFNALSYPKLLWSALSYPLLSCSLICPVHFSACSVLYYTTLYSSQVSCAALHGSAFHFIPISIQPYALFCTLRNHIILNSASALLCAALPCPVLHCIVLLCTVLLCTLLYFTSLCCTVLHFLS